MLLTPLEAGGVPSPAHGTPVPRQRPRAPHTGPAQARGTHPATPEGTPLLRPSPGSCTHRKAHRSHTRGGLGPGHWLPPAALWPHGMGPRLPGHQGPGESRGHESWMSRDSTAMTLTRRAAGPAGSRGTTWPQGTTGGARQRKDKVKATHETGVGGSRPGLLCGLDPVGRAPAQQAAHLLAAGDTVTRPTAPSV